jgi:hypothetical protein
MKRKTLNLISTFGLPLFLYVFYVFGAPVIYFTGLGAVGESGGISGISQPWRTLYVYYPFWIPLIGVALFPLLFKEFKNWGSRIFLIVVYVGFSYVCSQIAISTQEIFLKN